MAVSRPYDSRVEQASENGEHKSSTARPDCGTFGIRGNGGNSGTIGLVSYPNKQIMGHAWCCRRCQDHFIFTSAVQLEMKVRVLEGWLPS